MHEAVLILGAEPRVAIALARSFKRHGIQTVVAGLSTGERSFRSRAVEQWIELPSYRRAREESIDALSTLLSQRRFEMVIPITDTALTMLTEAHGRLRSLSRLACPDPAAARRVLDKRLTFEAARQCGVPVPATHHISSMSELDRLGSQLRFPVIAKPESKAIDNPFKLRYFKSLNDLTEAFRLNPQFGAANMIQEFADGEGVGVGVLMHERRPVALFQHRRLRELPATGGVSVLAISEVPDPLLVEHAVALLNTIEWEGVAMVEFKYDRANRRPALMEVNGRYWGSVSLAIQSGVDLPFIEWQIRQGQRLATVPDYRVGVRWRWMTGDLLRIHDLAFKPAVDNPKRFSVGLEFAKFLGCFRPGIRSALWSVTDPVPAVQEFHREIGAVFKTGVKRVILALLPRAVRDRVHAYRALRAPVKRIYLSGQIKRALRLHRDTDRPMPRDVRSIMFVCHGNIMRSPLAEAMLRVRVDGQLGRQLQISSAGTNARDGRPADPRMVELGRKFDIDLTAHRAKRVTRQSLQDSDLVIAMDFVNEAKLIDLAPEVASRIFLLGSFAKKSRSDSIEIPDPFDGGPEEALACIQEVDVCVAGLVRRLTQVGS